MPKSWLVRGAETSERNRRRMRLLGVTPNGHPLWQQWEVDPVVSRYPDYRSIFPLLPRRTPVAIYSKAGRLGVAKPRAPQWSDNELLRLRKVYPRGSREDILAAFSGRSYAAIKKAANSRGVYRAKKPADLTGNRLLDQVLKRADTLGYSLADLDYFVRSKSYFRSKRWRRKPNDALHYHAARALGGTVRAEFR